MLGERRRLNTMMNSFFQQGGDFQEQLRQLGKEIEKLEKSHRQNVEELRDLLEEINKHYEELEADEEIAKALSDLSSKIKVKQRIVPSKELRDATKAVTGGAGRNRAGTSTKQGRKKN
jgi:TolA-binding protein